MSDLWQNLSAFAVDFWPHLTAGAILLFESGCAVHAVLRQRDTRSAITWMGLIWLTPMIGAALYVLFGVNRIERRAKKLRRRVMYEKSASTHAALTDANFAAQAEPPRKHFTRLVRLLDELTEQPLLTGNLCEPLVDGAEAFPAMLAAIAGAKTSIALCTYIFDNDRLGREFVAALGDAVKRGVQVRVLIDDVGSRYSFPTIVRRLRAVGVRTERFMRTILPTRFAYSNLRTHRKILVVDGTVGFTGGMNIREGGWDRFTPRYPLHDLHFRCLGPVVSHLQEAFAEDWLFTTDESLFGEIWFPAIPLTGGAMLARGVPSGPDEDYGELRTALIAALAAAHEHILIVTPYFLPDDALIEALHIAVLKGVRVEIVLPQNNNLRMVKWACQGTLPLVLERECLVWSVPGIFDHTKLLVIDGVWTMFGSANWDPRSLKLNFEFNVECYDSGLASRLIALIQKRIDTAAQVTIEQLAMRPIWIKLRDGIARLWSPLL